MAIEKDEKAYQEAKARLEPKAQELAKLVCQRINAEVPLEDPGLRYSRQWTLERVIQILEARV